MIHAFEQWEPLLSTCFIAFWWNNSLLEGLPQELHSIYSLPVKVGDHPTCGDD